MAGARRHGGVPMSPPLANVLDLLRARGPVKQQGREWRCLCPAHNDTTPSLDVREGEQGKVVFICRSKNCPYTSIIAALGISVRDLYADDQSASKARWDDRIDATYTYRDEKRKPLFQSVRLWAPPPMNKTFKQRQHVEGKWVWNLTGVRRVLYRLPELIAADPEKIVYVCEGEKDVENMMRCGLVATTNPMGAGNWRDEYSKFLSGRHVVVFQDNDESGRKHTAAVRKSLAGVAASVKVVLLPDLPPKGDVSDWIEARKKRAKDNSETIDEAAIGAELERLCEFEEEASVDPPKDEEKAKPGVEVILAYFRDNYRPVFRRRTAVVCQGGAELTRIDACSTMDSAIIAKLSLASDAPRFARGSPGTVDHDRLPAFFKKWAPVAWGDLLKTLPDEDHADLDALDDSAADEFRRLVREAMLTLVVLGETISKNTTVTQTERRSLIEFCFRFAKPGRWKSIRSYKCWCKTVVDGEEECVAESGEIRTLPRIVLQVAIRHELFTQIKADSRLREMGATKFTRRAARYGVGSASRDERPEAKSAVVLDPAFVADLIAGLPDADDDENLVAPSVPSDG